jgi:hypothetical protein
MSVATRRRIMTTYEEFQKQVFESKRKEAYLRSLVMPPLEIWDAMSLKEKYDFSWDKGYTNGDIYFEMQRREKVRNA